MRPARAQGGRYRPARACARLLSKADFMGDVMLAFLLAAGLATTAPAASAEQPNLDWIAGSWLSCENSQVAEVWVKSRGGFFAGVNVSDRFFEYMRLAPQDGVMSFIASPGGAPPTPFALIEAGPQRAVFENPGHDFPQRVIYWREGPDLIGRIEGMIDSKTEHSEWRFSPAPLGSACPLR